jgi:hypothetical protein
MRVMRIVALLALLAGCPAPNAPRPATTQHTTSDNTCEDVAWSCVGMKPGTTDAWGCVEGNASQTAQYQASCTPEKHGRFALNACLRDNVVGGCTLARGGQCTTTWHHAPATRESVEAECAKQGALFVAP